MSELPSNPPFAIRARLLSPRDDGGWLDEVDGLVEVGETGRITHTGRWPESAPPAGTGWYGRERLAVAMCVPPGPS